MAKKKKNNSFSDMLNQAFPDNITPGQVIRAKRNNYGITLQEVEDLTGISISNLSLYENDNKGIGYVQATKIGLAIGLHPTTILFPNGIDKDERFREISIKSSKFHKSKQVKIG